MSATKCTSCESYDVKYLKEDARAGALYIEYICNKCGDNFEEREPIKFKPFNIMPHQEFYPKPIRKIKIFAHEYDFKIDTELNDKAGTTGLFISRLFKIAVDPIGPITKQEETLHHEILEAVLYHLGLKLEHEKIIGISEGMYTVLKENGWLDFKGLFNGNNH